MVLCKSLPFVCYQFVFGQAIIHHGFVEVMLRIVPARSSVFQTPFKTVGSGREQYGAVPEQYTARQADAGSRWTRVRLGEVDRQSVRAPWHAGMAAH